MKVPKEMEFTEIVIAATPEQQGSGKIRLLVNVGEEYPTEGNAKFKGRQIWNDGSGVFLGKDDVKPGDEVKIFVIGNIGNGVELQAYNNIGNMREISLSGAYGDFCKANIQKQFKLSIP